MPPRIQLDSLIFQARPCRRPRTPRWHFLRLRCAHGARGSIGGAFCAAAGGGRSESLAKRMPDDGNRIFENVAKAPV